MPISKVQLPSSNTPVDIRNGHSANVTYANGTFSATVSTVRTPYEGLILTLYFPTELDIEAGIKTVTLTFADGNNYTAQFMILGYSYEYVVPVLIQIQSITSGVLDYEIIHKGSVPSGSDCMSMEVDSVDDTQLNFLENSNAQSTVVITYPNEDIEGTSYEVYAGSGVPTPTEIDAGKVVKVNASGTGYELGEGGGGQSGNLLITCVGDATYDSENNSWIIPINKTMNEILTALNEGAVYCKIPSLTKTAPYYSYLPIMTFQLPLYMAGVGGGDFLLPNSLVLGNGIEISSVTLSVEDGDNVIILTE